MNDVWPTIYDSIILNDTVCRLFETAHYCRHCPLSIVNMMRAIAMTDCLNAILVADADDFS